MKEKYVFIYSWPLMLSGAVCPTKRGAGETTSGDVVGKSITIIPPEYEIIG